MSNDPLVLFIQESPILASIAAVFLLLFCVLLIAFWRLRLRLAAMQAQLDGFSREFRMIEAAQEGLLIRFLNLPRLREPNQLEEKNSKGSTLHLVEPKASPE
jgi:hypothetical protein